MAQTTNQVPSETLMGPLAPLGSLSGRKVQRQGLHYMREFDSETCELITMLSYKRPIGSKSERDFINRYLVPLGVVEDAFGNLHVTVGDNPNKLIFSSHTDSVHKTEGRQFVRLWGDDDTGETDLIAGIPKESPSNCLGADDLAGMWLMVHMIRAGVSGHYVFHYGEESGGIGSSMLNKGGLPDHLKGSRACIAFDRNGYTDVITMQGFGRTSSDAFAASMAQMLFEAGLPGLEPCPNGVYTDSAEYAYYVPECTNISVGYSLEHTKAETLNISYLFDLRDALLKADWSRLVIERDPEDAQFESFTDRYDRMYGYGFNKSAKKAGPVDVSLVPYQELVTKYPTLASEMLSLCQITKFDFVQEVIAKYGALDENFSQEYSPMYPDEEDMDF